MFEKILIANRGEIAIRVMRTARRMGIRTVAVYSDADAAAQHVAMADEAVAIGPAPARESYLVIDKIIEAARKTGAAAIHPGYGFLSENADFARACQENDIVFIGPPINAIQSMGEKAAAKALMEKANVPVVPGYHGDGQDDDLLASEADRIGYPVLIKAVAGGGGKGMRMVERAEDFSSALSAARREASNAFGDDKVLIERYLVRPRHIEIQVFADQQGNVVHLFERDCSLQRRHQKILEESPAPGMGEEMRRIMGEAAVAAARSIGYEGAGTVEFIADVSNGLKEDAFFFMEMNTRLQVEHPVTEMVTGQDLVEWQLRVANGEPLPASQDELVLNGHAIEARIYAENPDNNFFPSTGRLTRLRAPAENPHLRVDSGVSEGDEVSIYYDPMIAKLIVWDGDRAAALRRLRQALAGYQIAGLISNVDFLSAVSAHPAFIAGDVETGFVDKHLDGLLRASTEIPARVLAVAAVDILLRRQNASQAAAQIGSDPFSPWSRMTGWRLNGQGSDQLTFLKGEEKLSVTVAYRSGHFDLAIGDQSFPVTGELDELGSLIASIDGVRLSAAVVHEGDDMTVFLDGHTWRLKYDDPMAHVDIDMDEGGDVIAPLPGKILQVLSEAGAKVKKGTPLLVLEAMKMEHTITAPANGVVADILFAAGDQVEEGTILVQFEAAS